MNAARVRWFRVGAACVGALMLIATTGVLGGEPVSQPKDRQVAQEVPLGLEDPAGYIPADNPQTAKKIELGRILFFDKRLSKTNTVACANCHMPGLAFTDGQAVSLGINRLQGGRSAPTAINRVYSKVQFWDGRAQTLEEQSTGPFINPVEHGFLDYDEMTTKMKKLSGYRQLFKEVFADDITEKNIGKAIASFQRTLISGNSPADRFDFGGDEQALSASAKRGLELFRGKARCTRCHSGFNFTDEKFHNLGIGFQTALYTGGQPASFSFSANDDYEIKDGLVTLTYGVGTWANTTPVVTYDYGAAAFTTSGTVVGG